MLVSYIIYAVIAVVVLFILWLVLRHVSRWIKIARYRRLLPYSDIEDEVKNMSEFFNRNYVNGYILEYFNEDDNLKRTLENRRAEKK